MPATHAKIRMFVGDPLAEGCNVTVSEGQAHYLVHVMRLSIGAPVALFNGRDGEWQARITHIARGQVTLGITGALGRQQKEPGPWLAFAPLKKTGVDFVVEKATELGAERLWPVFTNRTAAQRINRERLHARAIEAAEQCGRLSVPEIAAADNLDAFIDRWPKDRTLLVMAERRQGRPIAEVLGDPEIRSAAKRSLLPGVLVGPEGGWAEGELDRLRGLAVARLVDLGPRVLRAETAALAALACVQATIGDWLGAGPVSAGARFAEGIP
jgi:16S rRNA (uracil1498-N3)-methyltransferase